MANPEHVKVVRQGTAAIAEWRRQNPGIALDLRRANLRGANLRGANLRGVNLRQARFRGADLRGAHLTDADLTEADLSDANLARADLTGATLRESTLFGARLVQAKLFSADLSSAHLYKANLSAAYLNWANLFLADLTGADLTGADIFGANLFGAKLGQANLTRARIAMTSLGRCNLSHATGLPDADHVFLSTIGVDTVVESFRGAGNKLTPDLETFFLGAGVPKEFLEALPRIVAKDKYFSCFISYGQPDLAFAKSLRDELAYRGVSCWIYALDATPGERTWKEISDARRQADRMLVICSVAALIRDGVLKEIEEQIDEDPNKIVPVSRDNTWNQPGFPVVRGSRQLKPFVDDRNYADFSDESRYEESLQRLLKALRRKGELGGEKT